MTAVKMSERKTELGTVCAHHSRTAKRLRVTVELLNSRACPYYIIYVIIPGKQASGNLQSACHHM